MESIISVKYGTDSTRRLIGEISGKEIVYFWVENQDNNTRARLGTSVFEIAVQWFNEPLEGWEVDN